MMFFVKGAEAVANVEIPDKESDPEGYEQAMAELQEAMDNMGVKALDDLTLEVTLEAPSAFFLSLDCFLSLFPA